MYSGAAAALQLSHERLFPVPWWICISFTSCQELLFTSLRYDVTSFKSNYHLSIHCWIHLQLSVKVSNFRSCNSSIQVGCIGNIANMFKICSEFSDQQSWYLLNSLFSPKLTSYVVLYYTIFHIKIPRLLKGPGWLSSPFTNMGGNCFFLLSSVFFSFLALLLVRHQTLDLFVLCIQFIENASRKLKF